MSTLGLLREVYGTKRRKGLNKPAYQHPVDVLDNCYIELAETTRDGAKLFRVALLHDVLEDSDITEDKLLEMVHLGDDDLKSLRLLSRNYVPEGENYIDRVVSDQRATIVKLADRIANFEDLILWVKKERGFNPESSAIAYKYTTETEDLLTKVEERYSDQAKDREHAIYKQVFRLGELVHELGELADEHLYSAGDIAKGHILRCSRAREKDSNSTNDRQT